MNEQYEHPTMEILLAIKNNKAFRIKLFFRLTDFTLMYAICSNKVLMCIYYYYIWELSFDVRFCTLKHLRFDAKYWDLGFWPRDCNLDFQRF